MADNTYQPAQEPPVRVTAEERPHPALQKLARAIIALVRLRQTEPAAVSIADTPTTPDWAGRCRNSMPCSTASIGVGPRSSR